MKALKFDVKVLQWIFTISQNCHKLRFVLWISGSALSRTAVACCHKLTVTFVEHSLDSWPALCSFFLSDRVERCRKVLRKLSRFMSHVFSAQFDMLVPSCSLEVATAAELRSYIDRSGTTVIVHFLSQCQFSQSKPPWHGSATNRHKHGQFVWHVLCCCTSTEGGRSTERMQSERGIERLFRLMKQLWTNKWNWMPEDLVKAEMRGILKYRLSPGEFYDFLGQKKIWTCCTLLSASKKYKFK